ncbi:MAG: class I SAM-dependent methyltransferase [Microthrixaceae bacterium]
MTLTTRSVEPAAAERDELRIRAVPEPGTAAHALRPLLERLLGPEPDVQIQLWDGSAFGRVDGAGTLTIRSADALRRIIWAPGELGLARAHVAGELDVEGDVIAVVAALRDAKPDHLGPRILPVALRAARRVGALGRPLPPPPEEARVRGRRHSKRRDAQAVRHHYDVGNDFYELVLGPSMTYSCAYFNRPEALLAEAQAAKHELVCRKLGLQDRPAARLLDVGCGWGSMAMHAAAHHGASVVGITISPEQADHARARVDRAGLRDRVEIRLQDYRDLGDEEFDAISSIGMFEHVGKVRMREYFQTLATHLSSGGRLLNHAISSTAGSRLRGRSFTGRYVFPDGELLDVGDVVLAMEGVGLEVRDVESLREHYARTLRAWVSNLEASWDAAVALVGEARARVWRLYMAGSAVGFEDGGISIHHVLGVAPWANGTSGMPATRDTWAVPTDGTTLLP